MKYRNFMISDNKQGLDVFNLKVFVGKTGSEAEHGGRVRTLLRIKSFFETPNMATFLL